MLIYQLYHSVLNVNNLYIKIITIYLKKHNQLYPISHEVNTRHAANKFSFDWPKKPDAVKYTISWELKYII